MLHLFIPPFPTNPWQPLIFWLSPYSTFSECHIVGFIQYEASSDWLLSLSNTHIKLLHVFYGLAAHFFLVLSNIPLSGCNTVYFYLYLLKDILITFSPSIFCFLLSAHQCLTYALLGLFIFCLRLPSPNCSITFMRVRNFNSVLCHIPAPRTMLVNNRCSRHICWMKE